MAPEGLSAEHGVQGRDRLCKGQTRLESTTLRESARKSMDANGYHSYTVFPAVEWKSDACRERNAETLLPCDILRMPTLAPLIRGDKAVNRA